MQKSEIYSDPTEPDSPTEGGKKSAGVSGLGQNALPSVDWINLLIEENEDNYKEKAPDQIVLDFMKRRKDFPFLNEWNSYFLREYFRKRNPGSLRHIWVLSVLHPNPRQSHRNISGPSL